MGPRIAFVCIETDGPGGSSDCSIVKCSSLLGYPKSFLGTFSTRDVKNAPIRFIISAWKESITVKLISLDLFLGFYENSTSFVSYNHLQIGLALNNSTFCPHSVFMYFVWIWEQTAIISLYSINWLVFITETECVYCAVRTRSLYIILNSAHTVYLCVLCGSENKQRLFPYTALTDWFL